MVESGVKHHKPINTPRRCGSIMMRLNFFFMDPEVLPYTEKTFLDIYDYYYSFPPHFVKVKYFENTED